MNDPKMLKKFVVDLTPHKVNSDETFCYVGEIWDNGDGDSNGIYIMDNFVLNAGTVEFNTRGCLITPDALRKLADRMEQEVKTIKKLMEFTGEESNRYVLEQVLKELKNGLDRDIIIEVVEEFLKHKEEQWTEIDELTRLARNGDEAAAHMIIKSIIDIDDG